jgi:bifunctional non-homologous end joining protein LigD
MRSFRSLPSREAGFVEPMECLAVSKLPDGPEWVYEIKLDGYRALAINVDGKLSFYSRRRKSFSRQYRHVFDALRDLPENTVVDGEIVALDDVGRPNFNFLQHSKSQAKRICYFVFDLLVYQNRDLTQLPLVERRDILRSVIKFQSPRVRIAEYFETSAKAMLESAAEQGLEGVVAKRKDSRYEAGKRSGAWSKYRLNSGQELVIGGYVRGPQGVDSIIVGFYRGSDLIYVARVRSGFVPAMRQQVFARLQPLMVPTCPFVNLPEAEKGRWGSGLTAADMNKCVWVRAELVARVEYLEWTDGDHLRHAKFAGLREDKNPRSVIKEEVG